MIRAMNAADHRQFPSTDPASAATMDALLLDVRDIEEWMAGHAPTADHIPMNELPERLRDLPRGSTIVCVCRSGGRSRRVTTWLRSQGFDAVDLTGGMVAWAAAGLPVVNHAGHPGTLI